MANLNDYSESVSGSTTQFGLNRMKLDSFIFEESKYGKQVKLVFTGDEYEYNGETRVSKQTTWVPLVQVDRVKYLTSFLSQFVDVLSAAQENAEETWKEIKSKAPAFDDKDQSSVDKIQEQVITKMLTPVLGQQVNVILHWVFSNKDGKWYLNIPSYKDNGYKLQFGNNPTLGVNLNQTKGTTVSAEPYPEPSSEPSNDDGWN